MRIHILAFLLILQSFASCQQDHGKTQPLEANLAFQPAAADWLNSEKALLPTTNIVFQSVDGGQTWQDVSAGLPNDLGVGRVFVGESKIFLSAEKGLYHSSTASAAPVWEKETLMDIRITDIFPGRAGPYFSSYEHGFFQKIPGTGVLIPLHSTLKDKTVRSVLETSDGTVFVGCESGIFKSTDGGNVWKQVFTEAGVNSLVEAEGVLVCATHEGLLRSTDGGEHWDWVLTEDGSAWRTSFFDGRFVTITQGAKAWQDGAPNRLRISTDGAKTWQRIDGGLSAAQFVYSKEVGTSPIGSMNDIKIAGKYLFCSCEAGVFRSSDWGKSWEPVFAPNGLKLLQLAVSGDVIYAVKVFGC